MSSPATAVGSADQADATAVRLSRLSDFGLLAHAVAGRQVSLGLLETERAYTDGATIYVPDLCDGALRDAVVVQAALLAQGSLSERGVKATLQGRGPAQRGRGDVLARYLVLEAARAAATPRFLPPSLCARIRAVYPGPVATSAQGSAALAAGPGHLPEPPAWFGSVRPRLLATKAQQSGAEASAEGSPGSGAIEAADPEDDRTDTDDDAEESKILKALMAPLGGGMAKAMSKFLGSKSRTGSDAGADGQEFAVVGARASRDGAVGGRLRRGPVAMLKSLAGPAVVGTTYPEWDAETGCYREGWCTVLDLDPARGGTTDTDADPPAVDTDLRLRRELARLGTSLQRRRHLREGDSLDTSAVVEFEVDRLLGDESEPRVFESRARTGRDLGVLILLDATGSTAERAEGLTVFDEQRRMVHRLTATLEELGDRVATYAFYSRGRENVRYLRITSFDSRYDHAAQERLAALVPQGFTRLGAAIRHSTRLLTAGAGTSNLALVVVGDGLPYDDGYEERYAREDTRAALREALVDGVGCVSLGIRSSVPEAVVAQVWGEVTFLQLEHATDLAASIRPALGEALRLAASRRRAPGGPTRQ